MQAQASISLWKIFMMRDFPHSNPECHADQVGVGPYRSFSSRVEFAGQLFVEPIQRAYRDAARK
jgi:hypothetical protein